MLVVLPVHMLAKCLRCVSRALKVAKSAFKNQTDAPSVELQTSIGTINASNSARM